MTFYTSSTRSEHANAPTSSKATGNESGNVTASALLKELQPNVLAEALAAALDDHITSRPRLRPLAKCESYVYETERTNMVEVTYCRGVLSRLSYFNTAGSRLTILESSYSDAVEEIMRRISNSPNLELEFLVEELGGYSFVDDVRGYQSVGGMKIQQSGFDLLLDKQSGVMRVFVLYPFYQIDPPLAQVPSPNYAELETLLSQQGLVYGEPRVKWLEVCLGSLLYSLRIPFADGDYAEALVEVGTGNVLALTVISGSLANHLVRSCQPRGF